MMIDQIKQSDSNSILCLKLSDIAVDKIDNYIRIDQQQDMIDRIKLMSFFCSMVERLAKYVRYIST